MVSDEYRSRQLIILNGSDTRAGSRINSSNVVIGVVPATTSPTPKSKWGNEGFQSQKWKNGGKPKGHKVNTSNHYAPGGHVTYSAAIVHLIRSETPRVMDSSGKPFIFYDRRDVSKQP